MIAVFVLAGAAVAAGMVIAVWVLLKTDRCGTCGAGVVGGGCDACGRVEQGGKAA